MTRQLSSPLLYMFNLIFIFIVKPKKKNLKSVLTHLSTNFFTWFLMTFSFHILFVDKNGTPWDIKSPLAVGATTFWPLFSYYYFISYRNNSFGACLERGCNFCLVVGISPHIIFRVLTMHMHNDFLIPYFIFS